MDGFFQAFGRAVVAMRWLIVLIWIIAAVAASRLLPSLGSEVNNNDSHFLPSSTPSIRAFNLAAPLLGDPSNDTEVVVVAERRATTLSDSDEAALDRLASKLRDVKRVSEVGFAGISPNGRALQLVVQARVNENNIPAQKTLIEAVERTFRTARPPSGLAIEVAGASAANVANQQKSETTGNRVQDFSVLFIVILLLFVFRSLLAPLITLIPAALALVLANRFIGGLGAHGLQISEFTELLLIVLMLGAGTDYGLFLVFRVREELQQGRSPRDAVAHGLSRIGESITASAGTVIFALLSLLLASFGIYRDLGVPLALGIGVMLLAGLTLLPALLTIFGRAAFWPTSVAPGTTSAGWWSQIARRLLVHPAWTLSVGVVAFAALASCALGFRSGGFGGAVGAPAGTEAAIGNAILVRNFPQASTNPTNLIVRLAQPVWEQPDAIGTAQRMLRSSGLFTTLDGPLNPAGTTLQPDQYARLHRALGDPALLAPNRSPAASSIPLATYEAYRATSQFVSADGKTIQWEAGLHAGNPDDNAAIAAVPSIRAALTAAAAAIHATDSGVAGDAPALYDVANISNHDLVTIVPIAILAIAVLLAFVLRSLVAPLYLIVSVGLSYLAALGVSVLVFIDAAHQTGVTFVLPFLMFIFLLALGEDYNILVMTRIREEVRARRLGDAVTQAVGRTGPTITSAGLVLAGSFTVLAAVGRTGPGGNQIEVIGFGLAIGILMDTFIVRVVLVPATVALLGRLNWWPSQLSRRRRLHAMGTAARLRVAAGRS